MEIPRHFSKFVSDYTAGKLTDADVTVTGDSEIPTSLEFEIGLPLYDQFGDPTGETHKFAVTVESLVSTKVDISKNADDVIAKTDAFVATYDALLTILDEIKSKKIASGVLTKSKE